MIIIGASSKTPRRRGISSLSPAGRFRAEWRLLGRGAAGVLEWTEAGRVACVKRPEYAPRIGLGAAELRDVREARVFLAGYKCLDLEKRVLLNGVPIGTTPPLTCFDGHVAVPVPPEKLSVLAVEKRSSGREPARREVSARRFLHRGPAARRPAGTLHGGAGGLCDVR